MEHAPIFFVTPPEMRNADEPAAESLKEFEKNIARAIEVCADTPYGEYPDLSRVSWKNICKVLVGKFGKA